MILIVGLGNPGAQYDDTRHNVGAATVRLLAQRLNVSLKQHVSRCLVAEGRLGTLPGGAPGPRVTLALAKNFMNESGGPISRLADYLKVAPESVLTIHDDLDLPAHTLRLKRGGGEGGHNGLKSLSQNLGSKDYMRLRIGIGRPPGRLAPAEFVLAKIPAADRTEWDVTYQLAADAAEDVVARGLAAAQQDLHSRS